MADQNPQHGRRQHFHRGRRGQERRGGERRGPGPAAQAAEQGGAREHREHVDVEQIMRDIRSRISQRHGIELTTQQIQELAARRLEAILDPRTVKPSLLEQIRRSTSTPLDAPSSPEPTYSFEDTTIYDSPNGAIRFIRKLLNPILKLLFNPNPLIAALHAQTKLNQAVAQREAERERRQAEWNSLHYEILQRLVLEISRTSLESQQLSMRVEALSAKVEFAERRARSLEGTLHQVRPTPRHERTEQPPAPALQQPREAGPSDTAAAPAQPEGGSPTGEGGRRRRRRRRGRRPQGTPEGAPTGAAGVAAAADTRAGDGGDPGFVDDGDEDDGGADNGEEAESFDAPAAVNDAPPYEASTETTAVEAPPVQETLSYPSSVDAPVEVEAPIETPTEPAPADEADQPPPRDPFTPDER